jgi:hypothetical protein
VPVAGAAAFSAYFAMYAFRKPLAAATFTDAGGWDFAIDYKSCLLIAQVIGYAFSKMIGIRVVAELTHARRAVTICSLVASAWLALVLFAILPAPWNIAAIFCNGLPLGMIWGLVFSYLEGRRATDLLAAILCSSFILSSGVVNSVAAALMGWGVSEWWMPAATGALFFPVLLVSVFSLDALPPPGADERAERVARTPMLRADRIAYLRNNAAVILLLLLGDVALTALRDFRDNFAAEIWMELGYRNTAPLFSASEVPVALAALAGLGMLMLIRNNYRALIATHAIIVLSALLLAGATFAFSAHWIDGLAWMILTGIGLFLAYAPFSSILFDRVIATIGKAGNAGFLIYLADTFGYFGSVGLLLYRSLVRDGMRWLPFYINCTYAAAAVVIMCTLCSAMLFMRRHQRSVAARLYPFASAI